MEGALQLCVSYWNHNLVTFEKKLSGFLNCPRSRKYPVAQRHGISSVKECCCSVHHRADLPIRVRLHASAFVRCGSIFGMFVESGHCPLSGPACLRPCWPCRHYIRTCCSRHARLQFLASVARHAAARQLSCRCRVWESEERKFKCIVLPDAIQLRLDRPRGPAARHWTSTEQLCFVQKPKDRGFDPRRGFHSLNASSIFFSFLFVPRPE